MSDIQELFGELEKSDDEHWFVVYTKPKQEKKLAQYALKENITYYLPLKESVRLYKYRKKVFYKPLFSGYVFVRCDFEKRRTLTISGHIVTFLNVINENELMDDLRQIFFGIEKGAELATHEYPETGTEVEIISGPFSGLRGVVEEKGEKNIVILQIHLLRKAVSVKVKHHNIRILPRSLDTEE
ncbi:MAG: hypothetical protein K8S23_10960 [Candidatus Cloacimonetes bacterium]|nr:hypothetical protein [Candidatus Cloacimonadota bacterium]